MTGLLLALFEERVDASKAGYELAQKLKRGGGGATPREELDMEMLFGDTQDFESAASVEVKTEHVDWTPEAHCEVPRVDNFSWYYLRSEWTGRYLTSLRS